MKIINEKLKTDSEISKKQISEILRREFNLVRNISKRTIEKMDKLLILIQKIIMYGRLR